MRATLVIMLILVKMLAINGDYCGECQGDCDSDSDCLGDLVCRKRGSGDPFAAIHGCVGEGGPLDTRGGGTDVCSHPFEVIKYVGECAHEEGFLCGLCQGDCDEDADCAEGLVCAQRPGGSFEAVNGCSGEGGFSDTKAGSDICVYPEKPIEYIQNCNGTAAEFCGLCEGKSLFSTLSLH